MAKSLVLLVLVAGAAISPAERAAAASQQTINVKKMRLSPTLFAPHQLNVDQVANNKLAGQYFVYEAHSVGYAALGRTTGYYEGSVTTFSEYSFFELKYLASVFKNAAAVKAAVANVAKTVSSLEWGSNQSQQACTQAAPGCQSYFWNFRNENNWYLTIPYRQCLAEIYMDATGPTPSEWAADQAQGYAIATAAAHGLRVACK